jgi:hypothetical protein
VCQLAHEGRLRLVEVRRQRRGDALRLGERARQPLEDVAERAAGVEAVARADPLARGAEVRQEVEAGEVRFGAGDGGAGGADGGRTVFEVQGEGQLRGFPFQRQRRRLQRRRPGDGARAAGSHIEADQRHGEPLDCGLRIADCGFKDQHLRPCWLMAERRRR